MDRRQRKTRKAIFDAFMDLLAQKAFEHITVAEIIERADVGRATFYAHFETKEFLLKNLCEELFCHVFDAASARDGHDHIFACNAPDSVFLHLFQHIQRNDNGLLELLSGKSSELFLRYFKNGLVRLVERQPLFETEKRAELPDSYWSNHIASAFVETVRWWIEHGKRESPEVLAGYFRMVL